MKTTLNWKQGMFSESVSIFDNDRQIGFVKKSSWSHKSIAELNGKKYEFREHGLLKQDTDIICVSENKVIGKIKYNTWGNKACFDVNGEHFNWEYKNILNTEWLIYDSQGLNISYKSSLTSGQIETNDDDAIKILSGLYVNNYYTRVVIVAFVCCFISLSTVWMVLH